jgi:hypothetical protein
MGSDHGRMWSSTRTVGTVVGREYDNGILLQVELADGVEHLAEDGIALHERLAELAGARVS